MKNTQSGKNLPLNRWNAAIERVREALDPDLADLLGALLESRMRQDGGPAKFLKYSSKHYEEKLRAWITTLGSDHQFDVTEAISAIDGKRSRNWVRGRLRKKFLAEQGLIRVVSFGRGGSERYVRNVSSSAV